MRHKLIIYNHLRRIPIDFCGAGSFNDAVIQPIENTLSDQRTATNRSGTIVISPVKSTSIGGAINCAENASPCNEINAVYRAVGIHQRGEKWFARELIAALQPWAVIFNVRFKLQIPVVVLRIDQLRRSCLGTYRSGHNGFGLKGEISLKSAISSRSDSSL